MTNGYHPLWMLFLVVFSLLGSGKFIFYMVEATTLAAFMGTYLAARALYRIYSQDLLAIELGASVVAIQMLVLSSGGMEIVLTIPLILALCWYRMRAGFRWLPSTALIYGLLAAVVVFSRLDAVLFVFLIIFLDCLIDRPSSSGGWLLRLGAFASGAVPIGLYGILNYFLFHTWTPISGQAKQLRLHHIPSLVPFDKLVNHVGRGILIIPTAILLVTLSILALLFRGRLHLAKSHLAVVLCLLLFPLLQQIAVTSLSDWQLWPWYAYSFIVATVGALLVGFSRMVALQQFGLPLMRRLVAVAAILAVLAYAVIDMRRTSLEKSTGTIWYSYGKDIEEFSKTHEGVYAMGDCAGTTGYLINQPLVQLEGLVMDPSYLENIRRQRDLKQVLANYNVRYYVTPTPRIVGGCFQAVEPLLAGPDSPKMRGTFCMLPVASYNTDGFPLSVFDLQSQ